MQNTRTWGTVSSPPGAGAGGEKTPQAADYKCYLTFRAALALAILASIVPLAALGLLVTPLLKNRNWCWCSQRSWLDGLQGDRALPVGGTGKSQAFVQFESNQVMGKSSL